MGIDAEVDGGSDAPAIDARRGDGPFDACVAASFVAVPRTAPVDVVWVVDTSGSMVQELEQFEANINRFASAIDAAELDYHVIVIADAGGVVVPAPLGTDATRFRFTAHDVGSRSLMAGAVSQFATYETFLREDAVLHFVFLTDDDSDMTAADFQTQMEPLVGELVVDGIVSPPGAENCPGGPGTCVPGCTGPYGFAQVNGDEYALAATATGGTIISICEGDWATLVDQLADDVSTPQSLPCSFELPDPPAGTTFDPEQVTLVYTPSAGGSAVPWARATDDCTSGFGWRYDDDASPTRIDLCPRDCATLTDDTEATVDIALGCGP